MTAQNWGQFGLSTAGIGSRWGSSLVAVAVDNSKELSPIVDSEDMLSVRAQTAAVCNEDAFIF